MEENNPTKNLVSSVLKRMFHVNSAADFKTQ